jgi:hypothetical protein
VGVQATSNTFDASGGSFNKQSQKFRHVYWSIASAKAPYHFRFSVGSRVFRDPCAFGRPVGVFNADCYGVTAQNPQETRVCVDRDEDTNTSARFPLADSFTKREQAAIECDFWKLVLRRKYFLEIPWSHSSFEAYLEAARNAQQEPLQRLEDESQWSHELLDFINEHQAKLLQHRDAHKPDLDLDEWARVARVKGDHRLKTWVEQIRDIQKDLDALPDTDKLVKAHKHLSHLRGIQLPDCARNSDFFESLSAIRKGLGELSFSLASECGRALQNIEERRRKLEAQLLHFKNSRPELL